MSVQLDAAEVIIDALRQYQEADSAMHARARQVSSMSDNEIRIIQYLLGAAMNGDTVTPTALSKHLGVTSASMTALLDRLERAGAIERVRHPSDRRSLVITATPLAEQTVGAPVVAFQQATQEIAADLTEAEQAAVVGFLRRLTAAADQASRSTGA
ncbi:MarR family transcriptional regulator [Microbacterium sp. Re1]|uniref:MarR family transcriptional regulator n=1 Tax=Microbacterium commune TaxID=2762219 RepID=A0ABR8W4F2_9MICO|nr:MarR family transcriptional regulator [Microbacterium commune]MBD8011875.1 MarR family transcriptional regulator [Microbacterium commune]